MGGKKSEKLKPKKLFTFRGGRPNKIERPAKGKGSNYNRKVSKQINKD